MMREEEMERPNTADWGMRGETHRSRTRTISDVMREEESTNPTWGRILRGESTSMRSRTISSSSDEAPLRH
eukprot:10493056-Heterocapsa_arctica.AAC.1